MRLQDINDIARDALLLLAVIVEISQVRFGLPYVESMHVVVEDVKTPNMRTVSKASGPV